MRKRIFFAVALSLFISAVLLALPSFEYTIDFDSPSGGKYNYADIEEDFTTYEGGAGAAWDIDEGAILLSIRFSVPQGEYKIGELGGAYWSTTNPDSYGTHEFEDLKPDDYDVEIKVQYDDTQGFDCGTWQPVHLER